VSSEQLTAIRRIFTATLIIGPSGKGKTSLAATFAEYLWEQFQKILLLASCDGGAFPTVIQKRVQQGLIRPWRMRTRSAEGLAFETCHLASKGYWPRLINPETGETSPAVQLVPPVTTKYDCFCAKGHLLRSVPSPSLIVPLFCSDCREMVTVAAMHVTESVHQTKGFEQVGGMFFDGITSMCGWFMGEMDLSRGRGNIGGEKPPLGGPVKSGDIVFGGNNRADYGFAQQRGYQIVHNSLSIPNLCEGPVFTGLPDEITESGVLLPQIGLKLSGSALSADSIPWFGNVVEAAIVQDDHGADIRRLYLSEYIDGQNRRHLLKNSGPGTLPKYLEDPPIDPVHPDAKRFFTGFNLGHFFKLLDQALRDELAAEETVKNVPGISTAPGDYGEAATIEPGTATPPPTVPASGIAPLTTPTIQPTVAGAMPGAAGLPPPAAPTVASSPILGGSPPVAPRARPRRARQAAITMPATSAPTMPPLDQPSAPTTAATPTPLAPSELAPAPPVAAPATTAASVASSAPAGPAPSPPTGTAPPPPPGMRPPQRAPGS
jgi:hypothetical protein